MKTMLLIALLLFGLSSCTDDIVPNMFQFGVESTFKTGNIYYSQNHSLSLEISKITESRCPEGVVCIWAGEATVSLKAIDDKTHEFVLSTFHPAIDTVGNYIYMLVNVAPYPNQVQVAEADKVVTLKIDRL